MTESDRHAQNLLGALSLAVADRMRAGVAGAAGKGASGATALSALHHFLDEPTVDRLRRVLGLTSSGTVRLIDGLEEAGYVRRGAGEDRRATTVSLTARGRRAARQVTAAREAVLRDALAGLSDDERAQFAALAGRVLITIMLPPGPSGWMCRLCDMEACGRERGRCPVASAYGYTPSTSAAQTQL